MHNIHSTAQHSTAQHSTAQHSTYSCLFFSFKNKFCVFITALTFLFSSISSAYADYTITIPDSLTVNNSGYNASGNITVTGLDSKQKLTLTASSANNWKLKSDENSIGYNLVNQNTQENYKSSATAATWKFDNDTTSLSAGIIVEDYSTKPAGTYNDTVTFTANIKDVAETPAIAQADCTFSPKNGTSTLSHANITTSMEYSTDSGTTWTDVTTAGSIASLAAGAVQIRVKETDDKLASEAVSITVPQVLKINELVGPYTGDKLTCEYYAGETWQALVDRYDLIKVYSGRAAFGSDGFIYDESGSAVSVTALIDNTKTYEVQ